MRLAVLILCCACSRKPDQKVSATHDPETTAPHSDTASLPAEPDCADLSYASVGQPYLLTYCTACHSSMVTDQWRRGAPEEFNFETLDDVGTHLDRIAARIEAGTMPPGGGAYAEESEPMLAWLECGAPGEAVTLPSNDERVGGDAIEVSVHVEEDGADLLVIREAEYGTRDPTTLWSIERYVVSDDEAWWLGYTLLGPSEEVLREVAFSPAVLLTTAGSREIDVLVYMDGDDTPISETWVVSTTVSDVTAPPDERALADPTEILVIANEEEYGWHFVDHNGLVAQWAQWMMLDEDRGWRAIGSGVPQDGEGFQLMAGQRWIERLVAPGEWSL